MPKKSGEEALEIRTIRQEKTGETIDLGMWLGRRQAFALVSGRCSAADAECIRNIRREKRYRALEMTWRQFCVERLGVARATADRIVRQLEEFGPDFFTLAQLTRVTPDDYRRLGVTVRGHALLHAGEEIPIEVENGPRLAAAIEELRRNAKVDAPSNAAAPAVVIDVEVEPQSERRAEPQAQPEAELIVERPLAQKPSEAVDLAGNAGEPASAIPESEEHFLNADRSLRAALKEMDRLQSMKLDLGERLRLHTLVGYGVHKFNLLQLAVHF